MSHLTDRGLSHLTARRALGVAALALPVTLTAVVVGATSGAVADPAPATSTAAVLAVTPRTTALPFTTLTGAAGPVHVTARATARAAAPAAVSGLPLWSSSFRYASEHKTYGYTMVGTDPAKAATTTRVDTTLTPVSFRFADGHVVAPSATVIRQLRATGLYTAKPFPGGEGQFGDVYMRTQFWAALQNGRKNWHLLLGAPATRQTLSLSVPPTKGGLARTTTGATVHLVDIAWFHSQIQARVGTAAASSLTQFLGGDVVLCGDTRKLDTCGVGGYHSGVNAADGAHTYVYASFLSSKTFGTRSAFYGLAPLSHEVAEWLTDPLETNRAPRWTEPSVPQYGCSTALEVGDPLIGHILAVAGAVYQDEAYLAYFSRVKPSTSWNTRYTWFGSFTRYSRGC